MPSPFPCSPVIRECSWNKTQVEKKLYYYKIRKKTQVEKKLYYYKIRHNNMEVRNYMEVLELQNRVTKSSYAKWRHTSSY